MKIVRIHYTKTSGIESMQDIEIGDDCDCRVQHFKGDSPTFRRGISYMTSSKKCLMINQYNKIQNG